MECNLSDVLNQISSDEKVDVLTSTDFSTGDVQFIVRKRAPTKKKYVLKVDAYWVEVPEGSKMPVIGIPTFGPHRNVIVGIAKAFADAVKDFVGGNDE